mgnify:CR=1 FL=1
MRRTLGRRKSAVESAGSDGGSRGGGEGQQPAGRGGGSELAGVDGLGGRDNHENRTVREYGMYTGLELSLEGGATGVCSGAVGCSSS